jgi:carbon storage regulator CsrA
MLILSRRPGDAILIDGGIRIIVLASGQRCVRLGIEAPAQVGIVREEVLARTEGQVDCNGRGAGENGAGGTQANGKPTANGG